MNQSQLISKPLMRHFIYPIFIIAILVSCTIDRQIPYIQAQGYFARNTGPKSLQELKIISIEEFDNLFGPAPVMGSGGRPTEIDFSRNFVLAVIEEESEMATVMPIQTIKSEDGVIRMVYAVHLGKKQTYRSRPAIIAVIPRDHDKPVIFDRIQVD